MVIRQIIFPCLDKNDKTKCNSFFSTGTQTWRARRYPPIKAIVRRKMTRPSCWLSGIDRLLSETSIGEVSAGRVHRGEWGCAVEERCLESVSPPRVPGSVCPLLRQSRYGRNYDGSKNRDLPSAQATLSVAVGLYLPCFSLYRVQPMNKKLDNYFGFIILLYGVWQVV